MSKELKYIGQSVPRVDGRDKTTGATGYLTDLHFDNMVHAYPIVSPVPFGRLTGIDQAPALELPGTIACYFAEDIPGINQVGVIKEDQPLLAQDAVRFAGDVVGIAAGETARDARQAAAAVVVSCEEYPPILSIDASREANDHFIHDSNLACSHRLDRGDIAAGFAAADHIIEAEFTTPYQEHYYLEPQGCIVEPEADNHFRVYGSIQCIYYVQKAVARAMGVPFSHVTVIQTPIGGGFGGKEDVPSELCARTAIAAHALNRPVKMVYRRRDDVQLTSKRHPFQMHYKVGVTNDGQLLAAEIELEENAGAYATLSAVVSYRATVQALGPYVIPNIKVRSNSYYTNLPPAGAFRGFGSPQATFGHERMMDVIAAELGIDPVELRLRNIIKTGNETATGHKLAVSVGAEETIRSVSTAAKWNNQSVENQQSERYLTALGIATSHYGNCLGAAGWAMDGAAVKIQIRRDGSITVAYGLSEMGQGAETAITQMTAEALGVYPGRITVTDPSTARVPDSGPGVASRNVVMTGNAIRDAAAKLRPIIIEAAAEMLGCDQEEILLSGDFARSPTNGEQVGFNDLAEYLFTTKRQMDMPGWWHVPSLEFDPGTGRGEAYFTYTYSTHLAKVKIDRLTGLTQVDKVWAAHDIGKAINPAGLEAQVEGGVIQGVGWALTEDFKQAGGVVQTTNLSTYLLPTSADAPAVETIIIEAPEPVGPWGAKGIGEPAIIPTAAAIANAVSRAVGVQLNEIPLTPEKVLNAIEGKEN